MIPQGKVHIENSAIRQVVQCTKYLTKNIFRISDFIDNFRNLSYKSLSMLYWVHYRLAGKRFKPKYIFKCDDDNLINIFELEEYLLSLDMYDDEIVCAVREEAVPVRIGNEKMYVRSR